MQKAFQKIAAWFMVCAMLVTAINIPVTQEAVAADYELDYNEIQELMEGMTYDTKEGTRVSVHDPSVVKAYVTGTTATISGSTVTSPQRTSTYTKEVYFIFGSHIAWAYSFDLVTWKSFKNNISTNYNTIFAKEFAWSAKGDSVYSNSGNMWAPDVIWNPTMGKWCMYMSINGCSWNSSICLLTADKLGGDWTYVGTVIYSGFTQSGTYAYTNTDYSEVTKDTSLPNRYIRSAYTCWDNGTACEATTWNVGYGAHAIDPCVFYDEEGTLWFSYGSWSGGIYIFPLDETTGFRDKSVTYAYSTAENTDPYMGKKLGGSGASGEASYIEYIGEYYYLFLSYGGLVANGGYNMRVFRSKNPDGPYVDVSGDAALKGGGTEGTIGTRLMSYYKWSFWDKAQVAQGHNSAFVDDDGNAYVVYHTRYTNSGELHQVRVHQLFTTENGYLVAAPFEYNTTDNVEEDGYKNTEIAGTYEILFQNNTDHGSLEYNKPQTIRLSADGKISGDATGTWTTKSGTNYITLNCGNMTYEGVLAEQTMEGLTEQTLCFTAVGKDDVCLWGYRCPEGEAAIAYNILNFSTELQSQVYRGMTVGLPKEGLWGVKITWESDQPNVISNTGVTNPNLTKDTEVILYPRFSSGGYTHLYDYMEEEQLAKYTVLALASKTPSEIVPIQKASVLETYNTAKEFNRASVNKKISTDTGLSISYYVEGVVSDWDKIMGSASGDYTMRLAVLSTAGCDYYEAAAELSDYAQKQGYTSEDIYMAYQEKKCYVTISFETDGSIDYYLDGNLMMTYKDGNYSVGGNVEGGKEILDKTNTRVGFTQSEATFVQPSVIAKTAIQAYRNGTLSFADSETISISGVIIGFGAKFDPTDYVEKFDSHVYDADYDTTGTIQDWKTNDSDVAVTLLNGEDRGNYVQIKNSDTSGGRSAYCSFDAGVMNATNYTISFDMALTGGNETNRSKNQVAIYDTACTGISANADLTSNYIVSLTNAQTTGSTTWFVNNESEGFEIPAATWVNMQVDVDMNRKKAKVVITNVLDKTVYYSKEVSFTGTGLAAGVFSNVARGGKGIHCYDNFSVVGGISTMKAVKSVVYGTKLTPKISTTQPIQWYVTSSLDQEGSKISGATSATYVPKAADTGKYLYFTIGNEAVYQYLNKVASIPVTVTVTVSSKRYDGTTKATVAKYVVNGALKGDSVGATAKGAVFASATIGNAKKVTVSGLRLTGGNAAGYSLKSQTAYATANILAPKAGAKLKGADGATYKVNSSKSVTYLTAPKTKTTISVPSLVSFGGKKYKVTSVADYAFRNNKKVTKVVVGSYVTKIGKNAFEGCSKLRTLTIGKGVTVIGSKAFRNCSRLKSVYVLSRGIKAVGKDAFKGIYKNARVKVPSKQLKTYKKILKKGIKENQIIKS